MNKFLKRFFYIFIANIAVMHSVAEASSYLPGTFKVDRNDISIQILEQVFGLVDGVLYGTGTQVVGKMFGMFNSAVIALGGIFLTYTLLVSTINTAQDGEVMGKQWSSIWIPMRVTSGVALLVPKASGYCMMQVFVMWVVVQGVGAANQIWSAALTYLEDGGVLSSVPITTMKKQTQNSDNKTVETSVLLDEAKLKQASNLMDSLMCMRALDHTLTDWENAIDNSGAHLRKRTPDFYDSTTIADAWIQQTDHSKPLVVPLPNFQEKPYDTLNGICGKVTISPFVFDAQDEAKIVQNGRAEEFHAMQQRTQKAVLLGAQQMMDELNKTVVLVGDRNEEQMRLYRLGHVTDEDKTGSVISVGDEIPTVGHCADSECAKWGPDDSSLSGYELQTSVLSYYSMLLPFLNQLNRTASELKFVPDARKKGWIMAGSYFFDMTRLNMKLNALKPEKYFKVDVEEPDINLVLDGEAKFNNLQNEITNGHSVMYSLYNNFVKNDYYGAGEKKRLGRGVQGIWRKNLNTGIDVPVDDKLEDILKDLQNRKAPESIYKKVEYKPYFKFSNVLRVPFSKQARKSCSITSLAKCLDENIAIGMWNVAVSIWNAIADFVNAFFFTPLEKLLDLSFGKLINLGVEKVFDSVANIDNHPIINLANTGQDLMEFTWDTFLLFIGLFLVISLISFGVAKVFWDVLGKRVAAILLIVLVIFGYSFAFYAPLLPYMIFLFAALGWMIAVVESIVAAPIVALGLTHPEGQNPVFGKAENAIMLIINVFLRPSLMIIGYIIAIILSYAFIVFTAYSFSYINDHLMGVSSASDVQNGMQAFRQQVLDMQNSGGKNGIVGVLGPIMMMVIFMFIYLEVVKKCFALIHLLPDQILRWLAGGIAEQFGNLTAGQMEGATQQLYQRGQDQLAPSPKALDGIDSPMRYHEQEDAKKQQEALQSAAATQGMTT